MARIVLGVSGSIAAYKACDLASKLVQDGHVVDVVMTEAAQRFVLPLTFASLTHRRVFTDATWGEGEMPQDHLTVMAEADIFVVAPCTANLLGKLAHGIADDILTAGYLAATCPVLLAPAMNHRMWAHVRVQSNVECLTADGVRFVGPEQGWLSEDEVGYGRMSEPTDLVTAIEETLAGAS